MPQPPRSGASAAGPRGTARAPSILVVENNPISRKAVRGALLAEGYEVTEAADGGAALAAAERALPDLVMLDLVLPDADGFDVAKKMRALPGGKSVPIVALSGALSRLEDARVAQSDFVGRLVKPFEAVSVVEMARTHVRSAAPAAGGSSGRDRHVLLVDPVAARGAILEKRLVEAGFRVTRIESAEKALDRATRTPPGAVLADVLLEGRDGFRLSADLRQVPALARVPVVLVSDVFTEEPDRRLARRAGADALIARGEAPDETVRAFAAVLAHAEGSPTSPAAFPAEDVARRLARHLERQREGNAGLARRVARDEARGAIVLGVAEALRSSVEPAGMLTRLLRLSCDAAGVSRGAAFLASADGRLVLEAHTGFPPSALDALRDFYGSGDLLREAFDGRRAIALPSEDAGPDSGGRLLADVGLRSILIAPLLAGEETLGVMVMASPHRDLGDEWVAFGRAMGAEVAQVLALSRAVAALRESEERLRQSQKMEAIGRLASGIAHDFNNLLTVMLGYGELLASEAGGASREHFASEIVKASMRASALTRQLLAFSRKQMLKPVVLDLNGVVAEMEPMLRRLLGTPVDLATVLARGLQLVLADPGQMEQVVLNLSVNARDAMPRGGKLSITTSNVRLDEVRRGRPADVPPGSYVLLAVRDSGEGMPPEVQDHVFEPFFTTKAKGKGTGLGLATVYGIVAQSGGRLVFESAVGEGTTFEAYLPAVEAPAEARTALPKDDARPEGGRETILLMEEEEAVRILARRVLEEFGYAVVEARDVADAIRIAGRGAPPVDLLVTGYVLAEMDGRELAIRAMAARAGLRALLISGGTEIAGADGEGPPLPLLEKPFTPNALARRVRDVLNAARPV